MNLYFDLDGTILEPSKRNFNVYRKIVISLNGIPLELEDYWQQKREKVSFDLILENSQISDKNNFYREWFDSIESLESLTFDTIFPFAKRELKELSKENHIYLVTLRRKPDNLKIQLNNLGLTELFEKIYIGDENMADKYSLLKNVLNKKGESVIIGDTEVDIYTAQKLGIKCFAVYSGIRSKKFLEKLNPTFIGKNIKFVKKKIKEINDDTNR
jgi:phosphoglycolate phosphatase-like HAD superfamily hydrolase